jgi:hypothetical protein
MASSAIVAFGRESVTDVPFSHACALRALSTGLRAVRAETPAVTDFS